MMTQWIIEKKRDGLSLSNDEIESFIEGFVKGAVPDYQASAFAMAVYFSGMSIDETAALTRAMWHSGCTIDTASVSGPKIDKHSTGGVGDKVSLALAPLAAACGLVVPMIAGRGLGITGGTLDKLESIPEYRVELGPAEFVRVLRTCGCSIVGQSEQIAPADKKLYSLRDVTGTVPSLPLIVSSILSKKMAAGLDGLVLDVKCGSGAFMKTESEAERLTTMLLEVAARLGLRASAIITNMNEPLGRATGNALELAEAIEVLLGGGPPDLVELIIELCAQMLCLAGALGEREPAKRTAERELRSGAAFDRFRAMVKEQGGAVRYLGEPERLPRARLVKTIQAPNAAWIRAVDAGLIGKACVTLGAGRGKAEEAIDHAVGITGLKKPGERVKRGETVAIIHASTESRLAAALPMVEGAFHWSDEKTERNKLILADFQQE